jgi:hypothetical protein
LNLAAKRADLELLRELATHGAITGSEDRGAKALEHATTAGAARLLLELGVDATRETSHGETPLLSYSRILYEGGRDTSLLILALIDAGADVRAADPATGATALHYCARRNHVPVAAVLLDHGADVNARDRQGATPLMQAVVGTWAPPEYYRGDPGVSHQEVVALLLRRGADPNLAMEEGRTPLTSVANSPTLTRLLLDAGADPKRPGFLGKTALDMTEEPAVAEMLIASGAGTPTQKRLYRIGLSPNLWSRTRQIGLSLLPYGGILVLFLPPVLFLLVLAVSPRLRSNRRNRGAAVGAVALILALTVFCVAVPVVLVGVFNWVAGKVLEFALPGITVLAWLIAFWAYFAGRSWYTRRYEPPAE